MSPTSYRTAPLRDIKVILKGLTFECFIRITFSKRNVKAFSKILYAHAFKIGWADYYFNLKKSEILS